VNGVHVSGGTLRTIVIQANGDLQYYAGPPGTPQNKQVTISVSKSLALIKAFWTGLKKLFDEIKDMAAGDDLASIVDHLHAYCSRGAVAPFPYVSAFA